MPGRCSAVRPGGGRDGHNLDTDSCRLGRNRAWFPRRVLRRPALHAPCRALHETIDQTYVPPEYYGLVPDRILDFLKTPALILGSLSFLFLFQFLNTAIDPFKLVAQPPGLFLQPG
jgi:hypothetical protein